MNRSKGFTIVELLIVIVVIGILAAIVIVAYNGIQTSARNTQRISTAKEWQKVLNTYIQSKGKYPASVNACLGTGYPTDFDGNPDEDCHRSNGMISHPVSALNSELQTVVSKPPSTVSAPVKLNDGSRAMGVSYQTGATVDGNATRVKVHFWLEGLDQSCGFPMLDPSGNTGNNKNSNANYAGATLCSFTITDPANI